MSLKSILGMSTASTETHLGEDDVSRGGVAAWAILWGSLLGGWGEYLVRTLLVAMANHFDTHLEFHPQTFWMAPLANLPLFAAGVVVAALVVRDRRRFAWAALFVPLFLAALEVGLVSRRVHIAATILLAAGIATQVARVLSARPRLATMLVLGTTAFLALAAIVGATGWSLWHRLEDRRSMQQVGAAPSAPNVLLLILDTVRASELGLYGYERNTSPALDSIARDGVTFEHAYATAPWTLPSHASIFTGRYPQELTANWSSALNDAAPTLAEEYSAAGYATGGFVGNLVYTTRATGLARGFEHFAEFATTPGATLGTSSLMRALLGVLDPEIGPEVDPGRKDARRVNREFLDWQRSHTGQPFFAFLNYFDAHAPYEGGHPYDSLFLGREPRHRSLYQFVKRDSSELRELRAAYDGNVRTIDDAIQGLLSELGRRGVLERTLVIITADHGEEFGEHGHTGHGTSLHVAQLHVPLIVLLPGRGVRGVHVQQPVTLRDLAATIEAIAPPGQRTGLPGHPLLQGSSTGTQADAVSPIYSEVRSFGTLPPRYPLATGDLNSIVKDNWHLIVHKDGSAELYRMDIDPLEQQDRSTDLSLRETLRTLRAALDEARKGGDHA